jgi:serine/threonine protein kinase
VGLTLAECAIGEFPFKLKENTIWEMMRYLEETDAEPIALPPHFSSEFREFIFAMMKFKPKDRPSAKALLQFEFIKKHEKTKPSLHRWVHSDYIALRRK